MQLVTNAYEERLSSSSMESKGQEPSMSLALRLPLSDKDIDLKAANKILSSAQTREKFLKIAQYAAKLVSYFLLRAGTKDWGKHFETLSKNLSTARRFFKLFRFAKHLEDVAEAREEKSFLFRSLLFTDILANLVADISEDWTSLEKVGIVRKGTLHPRTEYYANWCQLVLAVVEIVVSKVKADRAREKANAINSTTTDRRKSALACLELSKFVADLVKAFWDCELPFASELAFCISGLWAALVSTHKHEVCLTSHQVTPTKGSAEAQRWPGINAVLPVFFVLDFPTCARRRMSLTEASITVELRLCVEEQVTGDSASFQAEGKAWDCGQQALLSRAACSYRNVMALRKQHVSALTRERCVLLVLTAGPRPRKERRQGDGVGASALPCFSELCPVLRRIKDCQGAKCDNIEQRPTLPVIVGIRRDSSSGRAAIKQRAWRRAWQCASCDECLSSSRLRGPGPGPLGPLGPLFLGLLLGLCAALCVPLAPARAEDRAPDLESGKGIFLANCAACHAGGNNAVQPDKKLKKDALQTYGMFDVERIKYQVTNGKNAMPAFGERLGAEDIEDVANYVIDQANKGWS
ncbi:petJ [Symbiodinium natans]|uniref:Cytochrome c-553 n=1 Tax=Symbiodinium natans TaxID=878477 RepID=A0A812LCW1_9DINO|nr:petJ [Symbiodinium natans]